MISLILVTFCVSTVITKSFMGANAEGYSDGNDVNQDYFGNQVKARGCQKASPYGSEYVHIYSHLKTQTILIPASCQSIQH
jgi:hypothetical protein